MREVFPWEALVLAGVGALLLVRVVGMREAGGLGFAVALGLVTLQMLRTRTFVTETSLVGRQGLLFTRHSLDIPLSTVTAVRVEHDPRIPEDFADLIVEANGQSHRFHAVAGVDEVAAAIRVRAFGSAEERDERRK